jgi:hypothetical protein
MEEWVKYLLAEIPIFLLLLWSEYLGISKQHKSNAIIQLLMCALTPKEDTENTPPAIVLTPPSFLNNPSS